MDTKTPSPQIGLVYTRFPRPAQVQYDWPVLGSNPHTRFGKLITSSSRPSTEITSGVLHEPIHSLCFSPNFPPGSSTCQTVSPVRLLRAIRKVRSPGPKLNMHSSP